MKLLLETVIVLLGTLLAAAIVALGEPAHTDIDSTSAASTQVTAAIADWIERI